MRVDLKVGLFDFFNERKVKMEKKRGVMASKVAFMFGMALALVSTGAMAAMTADAMGTGICSLVTILTGKWLLGFAVLSVIGAGVALLFGGEMTDGLKKVATIIAIVGLILAASSILTTVFGAFGGAATCG